MDYAKILYDLAAPIVEAVDSLQVKQMPTLEEDEILLYVYADDGDIARLIGKKGSMASALRNMIFVAARTEHKRVTIKFETY